MNLFKKTVTIFILTITVLLGSTAAFAQETDNKVREMANETYVNRVKTSDKQTIIAEDESSLFQIILDFIGL